MRQTLESEAEQLHALAAQLPALCTRLAEYHIPATLEHGDFHSGNIMVTDEGLRFFDWTDGSVAHPFFSMLTLLEEGEVTKEERERLREAYELSQTLATLYHALSYYWIVRNTEPLSRWQWRTFLLTI
jgi:aminoglycoside phosphotransferase (APT) family kinase protein